MGHPALERAEQERDNRQRRARERLEALLLEAVESLERGEGIEVTPEYWRELRREARERLASSEVAENTS